MLTSTEGFVALMHVGYHRCPFFSEDAWPYFFHVARKHREKYRKVKEQRAAQGREVLEEHEEELRAQAEVFANKMDNLIG